MTNAARCIKKLKRELGPSNVLTNWSDLHAYSSDASPYSVTPSAVVTLKSIEHVETARRICVSEGVTMHPRGGGSGLAGGALGSGIVLDFSGLNRISKIDMGGGYVEVQAGVVLDNLNKRLGSLGLMFAPDPSSGDTCQIGGMLANNSSGPRSVKYGTTSDHVDMVDILLPDGKRFKLHDVAVGSDEFHRLLASYHPFEVIYRIVSANAGKIRSSFPRLKKNVSGYNLLSVVDKLDEGIFSLPRLLVGSEGTLCMFLGARLRVVKKPPFKVTLQLLFRSLDEVGDAVVELVQTAPAALEIVDGSSLDLIGRESFGLPMDAEAMLIVEYDEQPFEEKIEETSKIASNYDLACDVMVETDPEKQSRLWQARKAIVPTLYRHPGRAKPFGFIEDAEVPMNRVPELVRFINKVFHDNNLTAGIFGHIGDGNLHVRPLVDLSTPDGLRLAKKLYRQVGDYVISLNGSVTAEHGDGRLRAEMVERLYGTELYHLFLKIRQELNPELRLSPDTKLSRKKFTEDIDFEKVTRQCAACGKCNFYCPSYDVYGTEGMAARGWVRTMLTSDYKTKAARQARDGCLNCKNCLMVCPAGVDVSRYVIERRAEKRSLIAGRIFKMQSDPESFEKWVKRAGLAAKLTDGKIGRLLLDFTSRPFAHVEHDRILPRFARTSLPEKYPEYVENTDAEVAYFYGCADRLLELGSGPAAMEVLKKAGFNVCLPEQYCCGMPQQTYGYLDYEKDFARKNIDSLLRFKFVVTTCATCLGELLHYEELFDDDAEYRKRARDLSGRCFDISEFLWLHADLSFNPDGKKKVRVAFHQPCHLREVERVEPSHKLIDSLPGVTFVPMDDADRCCGAAGTYNVFHYDNSMKIFDRKKRGFESSGADLITSSCPTCVLQFIDGLKAPEKVRHVVELVNDLIG